DVILVQSASGEKPEKADFLAQAHNSGGGTLDKAVRPSELVSSPVNTPEAGISSETGAAHGTRVAHPAARKILRHDADGNSGTTAAAAAHRARRAGKETRDGAPGHRNPA